jgi:hypothetical protein
MSKNGPIRALDELRAELMRSAAQHPSLADAWGSGASGRRIRRRPPLAGGLVLAGGSLVAIVVVVIVIGVTGDRGPTRQSATATGCTNELLAELGVLQRRQTPADRGFRAPANPIQGGSQRARRFPYTLVPALTRLARTLPNGRHVFLVAYAPRPGSPGAQLGDLVFVFVTGGPGPRTAVGGEITAPTLSASIQPPPTPVNAVYISVVPDGVARVRWTFPHVRIPRLPQLSTGRVLRGGTSTATVEGNIADARAIPGAYAVPTRTTWLDANGHVIKTFHYPAPVLAPGPVHQGTVTIRLRGRSTPIHC